MLTIQSAEILVASVIIAAACFVAVVCVEMLAALAMACAKLGARVGRIVTPRALWITLIVTAVALFHTNHEATKTLAELNTLKMKFEYSEKDCLYITDLLARRLNECKKAGGSAGSPAGF